MKIQKKMRIDLNLFETFYFHASFEKNTKMEKSNQFFLLTPSKTAQNVKKKTIFNTVQDIITNL